MSRAALLRLGVADLKHKHLRDRHRTRSFFHRNSGRLATVAIYIVAGGALFRDLGSVIQVLPSRSFVVFYMVQLVCRRSSPPSPKTIPCSTLLSMPALSVTRALRSVTADQYYGRLSRKFESSSHPRHEDNHPRTSVPCTDNNLPLSQ